MIPALLAELDADDREHTDVSVSLEDGWTISAFASGLVVLEDVEADKVSPRHMSDVAREDMIELMRIFVTDGLAAVEGCPWLPGYY